MHRKIEWVPAYDERKHESGKNYGVGSMRMNWYLWDDRGGVSLTVLTGWYLPHVRKELNAGSHKYCSFIPMPSDLSYHSPIRENEYQHSVDDCIMLPGRLCYGGGSGLNAIPVFETFVRDGEEACWGALEDYHQKVFGDE
jgi:hypothetical protein